MVSKPSGSVCTYHHSVLTACKHFKSRVNAGDSAIQLQGKTMRQAAALENPKVSDWRWPDPVGWAQLPLTFQNVSCFRIRMLLSYFYSNWTEMLLSYVTFQVIYLVLQNKDIMFTLLKVCILKLAQVCIFCKKFEFETTLILSLSLSFHSLFSLFPYSTIIIINIIINNKSHTAKYSEYPISSYLMTGPLLRGGQYHHFLGFLQETLRAQRDTFVPSILPFFPTWAVFTHCSVPGFFSNNTS